MQLTCNKTAQIFIINNQAEPLWEGVTEEGQAVYFVMVAAQPAPAMPGVDKLVESLPLQTVAALATKAAATVQPQATPSRSARKPAASPAFKWPVYTPPQPVPQPTPKPAAPVPVPVGQMHPALKMRLEKAVATLGKKKADSYDRQQALSLLRSHRDKLDQIDGARLCLEDAKGKK